VQFARLDPHDGDGDRAAIGGHITGSCGTTCRVAAGWAVITDVRA
jgi:hypothetical protein